MSRPAIARPRAPSRGRRCRGWTWALAAFGAALALQGRAAEPARAAPAPGTDLATGAHGELIERQRQLEERVADQEAKTEDAARRWPVIGLGRDGFYLGTVESGFQLRLRGVVQSDGRVYADGGPAAPPGTFLIRRARLYIEGTVGKAFEFRVLPDFAAGQLQLLEAWVSVRVLSWLHLRSGKMKSPFGLERLQAEQNLVFVERGLASALAPDRDIGIVARGDVATGTLAFELGVLNGVPDGASGELDVSSGKDLEARLFVHPLRPTGVGALQQLGLGLATTWGRQAGTAAAPNLPRFTTAGQQTFFAYLADPRGTTAVADGARLRLGPQLTWYVARLGVLAEYVASAQAVSAGGSAATLTHRAWTVEASFFLTPDSPSFAGVVPSRPFDLDRGTMGAVELAARVGALYVDPAAFPTYADPTQSARRAVAWGAAVNWYFTRNVRLGVQVERTAFAGGASRGDRAPENALFERLQVAF